MIISISDLRHLPGQCRVFLAFAGRDRAVRCDGLGLGAGDLVVLGDTAGVTEAFAEVETGLCVVGLARPADVAMPYRMEPLRLAFAVGTDDEVRQWSRGKALLEWLLQTRYCGRCGGRLLSHDSLTARVCPECGTVIFPRIEPCIITLIRRPADRRVLLLRHRDHAQSIWACLAGFIEAGETPEQALHREVDEEVGLRVGSVRYFGGQSWPFPAQLMLAFTCDLVGGDLRLQDAEVREAQWFDLRSLPAIPPPGSIARRLIEAAVADLG